MSPPPFTEVVPTYAVRLIGEDIYVSTRPLPPGTSRTASQLRGMVVPRPSNHPTFTSVGSPRAQPVSADT